MRYKSYLVELRNEIAFRMLFGFFGERNGSHLQRIGSSYGGWSIPMEYLEVKDVKKILISAGIGFDVTFDFEMLQRGFQATLIDPDEKCCNFAREALQEFQEVQVIQAALSDADGVDTLYSISSEIGDRWSSIRPTGIYTEKQFPSVNLSSLLTTSLDSNPKQIVILKIDIEGAEHSLYKVIAELANKLDFVCIEIDYNVSVRFLSFFEFLKRFVGTFLNFKLMAHSGMTLCHHQGSNFFWINYGRSFSNGKTFSK